VTTEREVPVAVQVRWRAHQLRLVRALVDRWRRKIEADWSRPDWTAVERAQRAAHDVIRRLNRSST
jgi:hypothetical protein